MLSRVARVARLQPAAAFTGRIAPPIPRASLAVAQWNRTYANDNKPKSGGPGQSSSPHTSPDVTFPKPSAGASPSPSSIPPKRPEPPSEKPEEQISRDDPNNIDEQGKEAPGLHSLPDLTQGIPSTLEYEMTGATNRAALTAVQEEGTSAGGGGRGRGELPASAYISSTDRKRQRFANWMFLSFITMGVGGVVLLGRNWDEEEEAKHPDVPNGFGIGLWWNRVSARVKDFLSYYQEPAFDKLLPDLDPAFERPYTLCISLEDLLVHSEWSREHGWRVAKRPGVDYFLRYLSQYYELVLFTTVPFAMGEPLVRKLDPYRIVMWTLFREATKFKDGEVVKDLSYLNRDLSKVIIIDTNAKHVRDQPENAIILPKWTGDPKDKELVSLIPLLEYIHTMQYGDVRKVLKSFEGKHIPTEFARREAIARAEFQKQIQSGKGKSPSGMGMLGKMLGLKPSNMSMMTSPDGELNPAEAFAQGKMLQDIARERGQKAYEALEKEIRENGEKWLKEEAAFQEQAQQEAVSSMKNSFVGWFLPPAKSEDEKPSAPTDSKA